MSDLGTANCGCGCEGRDRFGGDCGCGGCNGGCGCGKNGSVCIIIISFAAGIIAAKFFPYSLFIILMLILLLLICTASRSFW